MLEHIDDKLWLDMPLSFYDICTIYPLTIEQYLHYSDIPADGGNGLNYEAIFTQFMINNEFLQDAGIEYSGNIWDFFWLSTDQLVRLILCISLITREEEITPDVENRRLVFKNQKYLDSSTYSEFCDLVLRAHCFGSYHHVEKKMPKFKSKDHYERWKRYQALRQKSQKKEDLSIVQCVKFIQLHSKSYIPSEVILQWSYWKMLHWYNAVMLQVNYDELHSCFAHWGGKDLRKSLDALKNDIMTKV